MDSGSDASDGDVSEPSVGESAARDTAAQQPDFYDPELDEADERWVDSRRQGRQSDAVLSCPGCLSTVCLECQAHVQYEHQFRAVDVINCRSDSSSKPVHRANCEANAKQVLTPGGSATALLQIAQSKCASRHLGQSLDPFPLLSGNSASWAAPLATSSFPSISTAIALPAPSASTATSHALQMKAHGCVKH